MDAEAQPPGPLGDLDHEFAADRAALQGAQERVRVAQAAIAVVRGRGSVRDGSVRVELDAYGEICHLWIADKARKPWLAVVLRQVFAQATAQVVEQLGELGAAEQQPLNPELLRTGLAEVIDQSLPVSRSPRWPGPG